MYTYIVKCNIYQTPNYMKYVTTSCVHIIRRNNVFNKMIDKGNMDNMEIRKK